MNAPEFGPTRQNITLEPNLGLQSLPYLLETVIQTQQLANISGKDILNRFENTLDGIFSNNEGPLMTVCTFNEEDDLPRLLLSLSRSRKPVNLLVVDNGSTDGTLDILRSLHINYIEEKKPGLAQARQAFFDWMASHPQKNHRFISTDADGIPGSKWVETMEKSLDALPATGGEVFGLYYYYGGTLISDFILSSTLLLKTSAYYLHTHKVSAHGGNFGIQFDTENKILESLRHLDMNVTTGNGIMVKQAVLAAGGVATRNMHPHSLALTRSDRFPDLKSVLKLFIRRQKALREAYDDWYQRKPGVDFANYYHEKA